MIWVPKKLVFACVFRLQGAAATYIVTENQILIVFWQIQEQDTGTVDKGQTLPSSPRPAFQCFVQNHQDFFYFLNLLLSDIAFHPLPNAPHCLKIMEIGKKKKESA